MAAFLSWASSAATAVKNVVVSTIVPETPPIVVPQLSSKRPPNKRTSKGQKPKKKPSKAKKQHRPDRSEDENEEEEDPQQLSVAPESMTERQASPTNKQTDQTTDISGGGNLNDQKSSSDEQEEGQQGDEEDSGEAVQDDQVAPPPRRKARKKSQKERMRSRRSLLATSLTNTIPPDPNEQERAAILTEVTERFAQIPILDMNNPTAINMHYSDTQQALELLVSSIEIHIKELSRKLPRGDWRNKTVEILRNEALKIEFSPDRDDLVFARKLEDLHALISFEAHRAWVRKLTEISTEAEKRLEANQKLLNRIQDLESRDRILVRLKTFSADIEITAKELYSQTIDISAFTAACLFQPMNMARKLERKFVVVLDQPQRNDQPAGRRNAQRVTTIWGLEKNVEQAIDFIRVGEDAAPQRNNYDRRLLGLIIGRGGAGVNRLEEESGALVNVDSNTGEVVVTAFGPETSCEKVFETIGTFKTEQVDTSVVREIPLDPMVGRALQALHRAKIQDLESDNNCRLTILVNPSDGSSPRVLVRGRPEVIEKAKANVKKELVDGFAHLVFEGPQRAITRLLVPPRNASETAQSRLLHEEFRAMRDALSLFVDRLGTRPAPGAPPTEDEGPSGLVVVCHKIDEQNVQEKLTDLVQRASYNIARIPIERDQLRIFTSDNRALIEASSQCRLNVIAGPQGAFLQLTGSDEAIETGKKVVAEILAREGKVERFQFEEAEVISTLLRDKAARLRALEQEFNVSISIFRKTNEATIVGDETAIKLTIDTFTEMEQERRDRRANQETLTMTIDSSKVPQLIGRQGTTINDIRQTSQVDDIEIPPRDDSCPTVTIRIKGQKGAVAIAQRMIERSLSLSTGGGAKRSESGGGPLSSSSGAAAYPRSRGRGRAARGRGEGGGEEEERVPASFRMAGSRTAAFDDDNFPTIESAKGMKVVHGNQTEKKLEQVEESREVEEGTRELLMRKGRDLEDEAEEEEEENVEQDGDQGIVWE